MTVGLDSESTDTAVPVELIQVATVPTHRQIDIATAHDSRAPIGVDESNRAVVVDRKARDRAALRIGSVAELAVLGDHGPARSTLVRQHGTARRAQPTIPAHHVRRAAAGGLGDE